MKRMQVTLWQSLARALRWTRSSYVLMSGLIATLFVIGVVWWPLAKRELELIDWSYPLWKQLDWLLLFDFAVMSLLIMAGADLKADAWMVFIGLFGGLVIESWGTQTELWSYYTLERPPLWIIPAWPIANLAVNRLARLLDLVAPRSSAKVFRIVYWLVFGVFFVLLLRFVWPTIGKSLTLMAIVLCTLLILSPTDYRLAVLTFVAGTSLGYFLELWGTTRLCWIYYTEQTPPLFSVLAHGMATVAFWRTRVLIESFWSRLSNPVDYENPVHPV